MQPEKYIIKYCPACGAPNFKPVDFKKLECQSCHFTYYHNVAAAVALVIENQGKFLFTKRKYDPAKGMLDLPGGFIDPEESIEQGLRREIMEELHIDIGNPIYITSYPNIYMYKDVVYNTIDLFYYVKINDLSGIQPDDDISGIVLLEKDKISIDDIGLGSIKRIVQEFIINNNITLPV